MRVAVYNRHWAAAGGAERFAGGIADVLSEDHEVTLVANDPFNLADVAERVQVDLSRVRVEVVGPAPEAVTRASARADLFVNASHGSDDVAAAPRSLYVVHFPLLPPFRPRAARRRAIGALTRGARAAGVDATPARVVDGAHPPESVAGLAVRWTDGEALLDVPGEVPLTVILGRLQPVEVGEVAVVARVGGRVVASAVVHPRRSRLDPPLTVLRVPPIGAGRHQLHLSSPQWRPSAHGSADGRSLGVALVAVLAGAATTRAVQAAYQLAAVPTATRNFLASYDAVVANSAFTRSWVRRRWGRYASVLYPPVVAQPRGAKEPLILGVGRFLDPGTGPGKHQLELVRAFGRLRQQVAPGWRLVLAGGCDASGQAYLDRVRRAAAVEAQGVQIQPNVTGAELRGLYARASLFWHATGLGEDLALHPERFEHFGITTVEAMSAGAVPIVLGQAGQLELFENGRAGYLWQTHDQLVARTRELIDDPDRMAAMSEAAVEGAERFLRPAFATRLRQVVGDIMESAPR